MMDKNKRLTKLVGKLTWILTILMVVTFFVALLSVQSVSNKIADFPDKYPEEWSMIGLGLVAILIQNGIFQGIYAVLSIPAAIFKGKSAKAGRTSVVDVVFSFLIVAISLPSLFYGLVFAINTVDLLTYGLGVGFVPYVIAVLLHLTTVVLMVVQIVKCWPKKEKAMQVEAA